MCNCTKHSISYYINPFWFSAFGPKSISIKNSFSFIALSFQSLVRIKLKLEKFQLHFNIQEKYLISKPSVQVLYLTDRPKTVQLMFRKRGSSWPSIKHGIRTSLKSPWRVTSLHETSVLKGITIFHGSQNFLHPAT